MTNGRTPNASVIRSGSKKLLAVLLSVLLTVTAMPVFMFGTAPTASAYSTFTKNYSTEYYYSSSQTFISGLCVGYDSSSASTVKSQMQNAGWTPVANFLDMMQDWSGTKNIYVGYKTTSDPTQALTGIEFYDSDDAHSNYSYHGKNKSWDDSSNRGSETINGTSYTGVKDKNTGIVFFRVGGSPLLSYSVDGIVDFLMKMGSGYGYEFLCATKNRSAGSPIISVNCFSGTSSGWTMATCLARGCSAHSSAHGHSTRYVGFKRLTTTVDSDTLRSNYSSALTAYNNRSTHHTTASVSALDSALSTASSILTDLNDGFTTYTQAQINSAATALATAKNGLTYNTYTVTLNNQSATSAGFTAIYQKYNTGWYSDSAATNSISSITRPAKTGYTFGGYYTSTGGGGNQYITAAGAISAGNTVVTGNTTWYAKWTANSYTIKFNGNGSTSGSMSDLAMTYGVAKNLTANAFAKTGYTFLGWSTSNTATSATYSNSQSVSNLTSAANGTVTLYAVWATNAYTVSFNGNGATSGEMADQSFTYDVAQNLSANAYAKTGYTFLGWSTSNT
nr:InlB B-repeat-containing protein [Clostridia bacterium]